MHITVEKFGVRWLFFFFGKIIQRINAALVSSIRYFDKNKIKKQFQKCSPFNHSQYSPVNQVKYGCTDIKIIFTIPPYQQIADIKIQNY